MKTLIGITGPATNGKDTVGAMLLKHMPNAVRFAYADKLKEFLKEALEAEESMEDNKEGLQVFTLNKANLFQAYFRTLREIFLKYPEVRGLGTKFVKVIDDNHEDAKEHLGIVTFTSSWRKLMQLTGTEWGRQCIDPLVWVTTYLPPDNAVVTDVRAHGDDSRYLNIEAAVILNRGGIIIKVIDPRKSSGIRKHSSETSIEEEFITHTIINDGTLEDLQDKVDESVKLYL